MSEYMQVEADILRLATLNTDGEAFAIWRGSLLDELAEHGYSRKRAEQVIDELRRWHRDRARADLYAQQRLLGHASA